MHHYTQKILCHTAIVTLLSTSFYPLYGGGTKEDLLVQEEGLQAKNTLTP